MLTLRRLNADQQRNVRHQPMKFVVVLSGVLLALWLQQWGERHEQIANLQAAKNTTPAFHPLRSL